MLENGHPHVYVVADMRTHAVYVGEWQPKGRYGHRYVYIYNLCWRMATQVYIWSQICVYTQFTLENGNPRVGMVTNMRVHNLRWKLATKVYIQSQICVYTKFTVDNGNPSVCVVTNMCIHTIYVGEWQTTCRRLKASLY